MSVPIVETCSLRKVFGVKVAIEDLSLEIYKGTCVGLIGHNGAGKTTALCMLSGLLSPSSGRVLVLGADISKRPEKVLSRINFASNYMDFPGDMSVVEVLLFFARLYSIDNPRQRVEILMEELSIDELRNERIISLSAGQRARVMLAKGMINNPVILFLDEPTASLDPVSSALMRKYLLELKTKTSTTIVFSSHNMKDVDMLCDQALFFEKGKIVASGSPGFLKELCKQENIDDVYIALASGEVVESNL
ncbi:ATP-binding cassette domain-containing protein [Pseudomonas syringae pv. theae]|uniref:ABC transporter domain-containing protein n=1 Tax=Pseudomonas syringae pv. actinidiae TaxID=103796 RepID=A0A3M4L034_PSESF|nr:ABC transporter ATP-binding protein [Pseudomonas syringae]KPZ30814.1 hypothetical protein AN901_200564 [Pseudomonas syringae pv. theae]RMQ34826.1 hypothetical protein ALQ07_200084 [Pseudomonas syringae pv. actinidiae]GKQ28051.1 ATP-binding cassette domain-containing protein [Pseudomonas syringae pv. theae]GKS08897.1 ATP-binding cassette domain-containing protein [Pseudomonas syringae pv. theae]